MKKRIDDYNKIANGNVYFAMPRCTQLTNNNGLRNPVYSKIIMPIVNHQETDFTRKKYAPLVEKPMGRYSVIHHRIHLPDIFRGYFSQALDHNEICYLVQGSSNSPNKASCFSICSYQTELKVISYIELWSEKGIFSRECAVKN